MIAPFQNRGAQGEDRLDSVHLLKENDRIVQTFVDEGGLQPDERWLNLARKSDDGAPRNFLSGPAQNRPNPFAGATTITFELAERASVRIAVYDMLGREPDVLIDDELDVGAHEAHFNASTLPPGIYFYRMETQASAVTRPMVVLE